MKGASREIATEEASLLDELKEKQAISSDAKLAASLGVTRGYLCSVRKGRKRLSLDLAKEIFSRLGRTYEVEEFETLLLPAKVRRYTSNLKMIRDYVIARANGHCQLCGIRAPFDTPDGQPYLEMHQVIPVREGGGDTADNLIGLCPNCHRKVEFSPTPVDIEKIRSVALSYKKSD